MQDGASRASILFAMGLTVVCPAGFCDRLDKAIACLVPSLARAEARRLIAAGAVFLDGRRCRVASRVVREGSRVRIETVAHRPSEQSLRILYDANGCVAVDKPAGMPVAATRRAASGTAMEILQQQLRAVGRRERLWLVHRLDAATSGVVVFATTRPLAVHLGEAFRKGELEKKYLALVTGVVQEDAGIIRVPIRVDGRRACCDPAGKPAETVWRVLERHRATMLLELRPATGRMHQLRVHLQEVGLPIVGDRWYGGKPAARLMLHAATVRFGLTNGAIVELSAPLPAWAEKGTGGRVDSSEGGH